MKSNHSKSRAVLFVMMRAPTTAAEPRKPLFKNEALSGGEQKGGRAKYTVEDSTIVGSTVLNPPNSFLCTKQFNSDFILKLEFKIDPQLNSGVHIHSGSFPENNNGRVHGYQVEIDPSDRAWTGGIYEDDRRSSV